METFTELFPSVHDLLSLKEALGKLAGKIEIKIDFKKIRWEKKKEKILNEEMSYYKPKREKKLNETVSY